MEQKTERRKQMAFKNVILEKEEAVKWAEYFDEKYGDHGGATGDYRTWGGMTVNKDKSMFIRKKWVNHEDPNEIELYYFWHGYLFSVDVRQVWGDDDLEAWEFSRLMSYPRFNYSSGIHLPEELIKDKEQILQDFKTAMVTYGRKGIGISGYEKLDPPLPHIQIRVGDKVY